MKKYFLVIALFSLLVPAVSFAQLNVSGTVQFGGTSATGYSPYSSVSGSYGSSQCGSNNNTLCTLIQRTIGYLNQILVLLIGLAVVVFVYYVFKYFIQPNENRKEAGSYVLYSVIGFFVILSLWGLVNIVQNTFGVGNQGFGTRSWNDISNIFPH